LLNNTYKYNYLIRIRQVYSVVQPVAPACHCVPQELLFISKRILYFYPLAFILPIVPKRNNFNVVLIYFVENQINFHWNYSCKLVGS